MIGVNSLLFLVHREQVVFAFCTSYDEGFREKIESRERR